MASRVVRLADKKCKFCPLLEHLPMPSMQLAFNSPLFIASESLSVLDARQKQVKFIEAPSPPKKI